jgi:hypothetical protein
MATRRPAPTKIVQGTGVAVIATMLVVLGGIGIWLLWLMFRHSRVLTPVSTGLLSLSVTGFVATIYWSGWTLVDVTLGRIDAAKRRRWIAVSALLAAFAVWLLAAVVS